MNVQQALQNLFEKHRIVFWYDLERELRAEYERLTLPDVEKIELNNNEFGVKYRILRQEDKRKFLLYYEGPQPAHADNWLLDVLLAHGHFQADQMSLWLNDVGLDMEFRAVVQAHPEFFKAASRRAALKARLDAHDTAPDIRLKMLAICAGAQAEAQLESILEILLEALAQDQDEAMRLIKRAALDDFFWSRVERAFGYASDNPGIRDFALTLFHACYRFGLGETPDLFPEAVVFLKRWKDSRRFQDSFTTLSDEYASILNIEADLLTRELESLIEIDYFRLIDQKILSELVDRVTNRTISLSDSTTLIRQRRTSHWFADFRNYYEAIEAAAHFMASLDQAQFHIQSLADGIKKYAETWHTLDQRYRQFIYHYRGLRQISLLQPLYEQVENLYANNFLLKLNDTWQQVIDTTQSWDAGPILSQRHFFASYIAEFVKQQKKVVVIISDAMRYEIGAELLARIEREDRYTAQLEPMLAMLPSYTQLGMAALLPNEKLDLRHQKVFADGQDTQGTANRSKILAKAVPDGATALQASDLLAMNREESRALFRDNYVIYVYHDRIDSTGDKRQSEERVFEAVEETLAELIDIIKKLANANVTNMVITADHGFIYQNRPLDDSDFSAVDVQGAEIYHRDRRYVIGQALQASQSVKSYRPAEVGLEGDYDLVIVKSINRLRQQGTGSRYVHGGASLQEVVVPVVQVNKKRSSDLETVEVDMIRSSSSIITTGQLSVAFYQQEPVSAKVQSRQLRAGIYTENGGLISDQHDLIFDNTSDNPRDRETQVRFVLSREAAQINNQTVYLKLEALVPNTTYYREYKSEPYTLRRSIASDFDL